MLALSRLMDTKTQGEPGSAPGEMQFDGREMAMVHRMFRREFLLASQVVRRVACGDTRRAHTVTAHLRFIGTTLHHHHSGEDSYVWPLLVRRAPSHVSQHLLRVMEQHRQVDAIHAEVDGELPLWSCSATADSRDRLAGALDRLAVALIDHMDYEEMHVVPVMEAHIGLDAQRISHRGEELDLIGVVCVVVAPVVFEVVDAPCRKRPRVGVLVSRTRDPGILTAALVVRAGVQAQQHPAVVNVASQRRDAVRKRVGIGTQSVVGSARRCRPTCVEIDKAMAGVAHARRHHRVGSGLDRFFGQRNAGVPRVPAHRRREPLPCAGIGCASGDARAGQAQRGDDRRQPHAHRPRIADQGVRAL
jgi:hemerythrin-like domain-containing protein